jgi:hypothetical protein
MSKEKTEFMRDNFHFRHPSPKGEFLRRLRRRGLSYCLFFTTVLFFVSSFSAFSQQRRQDPWWYTLEQGKRHFRNGAYGDALRSFEDARENRRNYYAKLERDLVTVLSIHEVRRLGDDLSLLEVYIEKQFQVDAADALKELYYRIPKASLHNSSQSALTELGRLKAYPEAEYWIGESYRMEGEFGIALSQYQKAYNDRALLETPGFATEIQYKIADLRRIRREYNEMTLILEDILKTDAMWSGESFNRANMMRSLETNGINRFLVLFRHNEPAAERAHRTLGLYYYTSGRHNRAADHLLFAFLIQYTLVIDSLLKTKYDYTFTSLDTLIRDIAGKREILSYMDEVEYYRTMYYLANSLYGNNRRSTARELWTFLSANAPGEWRGRAAAQLRNPELDRVPETIGRPAAP